MNLYKISVFTYLSMDNINWTTEYRQQMDVMAAWGEREWYRLNGILQYLLWAAVLLSVFLAILILSGEVYNDVPRFERVFKVITLVAISMGAFLLILLRRIGFYLLMATQVLPLVGLSLSSEAVSLSMVISATALCVFGMAFIAGSLLLTNRCKINAYDLLWPEIDSVRPVDFLEVHAKSGSARIHVGR